MSAWPLVVRHDDGIRPAGDRHACLYCKQRIGQPHGRQCVIVTRKIELRVRTEDGSLTGLWVTDEPYYWEADNVEFHKNESSWCASNILHEREQFTWDQPDAWERLEKLDDSEGCGCLCNVLRFEFSRIVDATPKRLVRTECDRCNSQGYVKIGDEYEKCPICKAVKSSEPASSQKTAAKDSPLHGALVGGGADSGEEGKR